MHESAPKWMTKRVQEIDPDLSVVWLAHEGKYAVVQPLADTPSLEETADAVGDELHKRLQDMGYPSKLWVCRALAYSQVEDRAIVVRVEDRETGAPIELDERTLGPLRRMAWLRRHWGAEDYMAAHQTDQYEAKRRREQAKDGLWDSVKRDKVFASQFSDIMWGMRPFRSVDITHNPLAAEGA